MPARLSSMELSSPSNPDVDPSAKPSRRKSGRVVKAPDILGAKRKRIETDEDEDESQTEGNNSDGEPDEEEIEERRRKVKRNTIGKSTTKRSKTDTSATQLAIRPAPKPRKTIQKTVRPRPSAAGEAIGLYASVFASETSLDDAVGQWLKQFSVHEANALTEVINFVLRCTGCTIQVSVFDIEDPDNCSSKLADIQEEFQAQKVVEYPLIDKNKVYSTAFRRTLTTFFKTLIHGIATSSLLYKSPELVENLQSWIVSMSSAASRPFRHTATVISISIISALCEIGRDLVNGEAKTLRQSEGELRKKSKVNQARIRSLQDQAAEFAEKKVKLDDIIKDWYDTVFVHRYRDIDPRIRLDCMTYLGDWIMTYPDHFLQGTHLRYLGWVLSDIAPGTRLEVVKQLHRIYKDESKIAGLRDFTDRFRPRMVEMAVRDADPGVRAATVDMLDDLREAGMLEPNDIDTIGQLIYDTELRVRKAVVPFFVASIDETFSSRIEEIGGEEVLEEIWPAATHDDFDNPRMEWLKFKSLAELLQSFDTADEPTNPIRQGSGHFTGVAAFGDNSRFTVAALSLSSRLPEMKKWEVLAAYLLFDHSTVAADVDSDDIDLQLKQLCKLNNKEEIILLDVLNTSVRQCLTNTVEEGSKRKKTKKSKAEVQVQQGDREAAAQRLAAIIPKLLKKFGATPDAASAVLRLEHVLNLNVFQELRQDSTTYSALLDDINKQFLSHEDENVLLEASKALQHAKSFDQLGEITEDKVQTLWEDVTKSLVSLCRGEDLALRGGIDVSILAEISSTVLRISNLARISDCTEMLDTPRQIVSNKPRRKQNSDPPIAPVSLLIQLMSHGRSASHVDSTLNAVEDTLVSNTLESLVFYFMWRIIGLRSVLTSDKRLDSADVATLVERRNAVAAHLEVIMTQRQGLDGLRVEAAGALMDLHSMFITVEEAAKTSRSPDMSSLADLSMELSPRRQTEILRVFTAAESDFAKKSKRQLEEASPDDEPEDLSDDDDDEDPDQENAVNNRDESEEEEVARRKAARAARKEGELLLAEEKLCTLASKMVIAIRGGVMDREHRHQQSDSSGGPVRQRLSRNRAKLGHNFKEIVAALEKTLAGVVAGKSGAAGATTKGKNVAAGGKAVGGAAKGQPKGIAKSTERVVDDSSSDDDVEDEDEDDDSEENLRARGLVEEREAVEDDDGDDADEGVGTKNGAKRDAIEVDRESLLGD